MIKLFFYFGIVIGSMFPIKNSKPKPPKVEKDSVQIAPANNCETTNCNVQNK